MISVLKTTFLSAAIFDFVNFQFRSFLEGLYGNRANFKREVWDTGWVFCKNSFRFVISASKTTFLSAAIFDFVKFQFRLFLEGLYGNPANFKREVWDTGWVFCKNFSRFVISASKTTFLSAAIFDFVKFQFRSFLEGLYWNPGQLQTRGVGHWMGILQKFFQIRNQRIKNYLSVCGDFWFHQISFLVIFRGFVWESAQLQARGVGHWMGILQKFFQIRNQHIKNYLSICGDFWISQIPILVFFKGLYGNWPFSRLKLWDVRWRHPDEVMFFFSFDPWAIFLPAGIFEFRPKNFFNFSNLNVIIGQTPCVGFSQNSCSSIELKLVDAVCRL